MKESAFGAAKSKQLRKSSMRSVTTREVPAVLVFFLVYVPWAALTRAVVGDAHEIFKSFLSLCFTTVIEAMVATRCFVSVEDISDMPRLFYE